MDRGHTEGADKQREQVYQLHFPAFSNSPLHSHLSNYSHSFIAESPHPQPFHKIPQPPSIKMQFSFLAASTLFLSALAAPTPALSNTDLSSLTDKSPLETNGVTDSVESTVTSLEQGSSPITERQAEPLIELLDGLLDTISPIAGEVVDLLAALGGSEAVTESALALVDLEGLLNEIVIEIENVVGNITSGAIPGAEDKDLAGVVGEIVKLVNEVVVKVEGAAGVGMSTSVISFPWVSGGDGALANCLSRCRRPADRGTQHRTERSDRRTKRCL